MPRWRRRKLIRFNVATIPLRDKARDAVSDRQTDVSGELAPVARLSERLGHFPVSAGSAVEFLADYDGTLARIAADIDAARHHAHLLFYIAAADASTEPVMAALERAAARGVTCRLIYDAHGSNAFARGLRARLRGAGVDLRAALPIRFFARRGTRADLRNHRKIVAVDGRVGYVGSQNLVDRRFKKGIEYEDFVARVEGPVVSQLQLVFACDWWLETDQLLTDPAYFPPAVEPGAAVGQVLPSGPEFPSQNFQRVLVDVVHQARRQVTVVTPYLVPDDALLQAFETATHRGVRVRLIVSRTADQVLVRLCQESYYGQMLETGVELFRYCGPFLHAKHATADESFGLIGSCNADIRSFQLNSEVSLLLYDRATTAGVLAREEYYVAHAERLTKAEWAARPRWRRLPENLARIWSPLL
jgi:cardiolipin synthase